MTVSAIFASMALLSAAQQTAPQPASRDVYSTELEAVIIEGRRVEEAARAYAREVGEPPRGTRLARWNAPVCVSMTNMQPQFAQFVIDRIAVNALNAGADVGGPGCRPNVIILATMDGPELARKLVREAGLGFRPAASSTNLSHAALSDFQNSEAPVRWWNVVMPVTADTGDVAAMMYGDSITPDGDDKVRGLTVRDGSRIRSNIRYDMAWTIVIVDMARTDGVAFGALADYISMVSLAQIDASADLSGHSTIMSLFNAETKIAGISQWDRDYLAALYATPPDRLDGRRQEAAVVSTLLQQRRARERLDEASTASKPLGERP